MKPKQAALTGALTGFLFGSAICLIQNISIADTLFRLFVLTAAGAWMGVMLAWLNQLLPNKSDQHHSNHSGPG